MSIYSEIKKYLLFLVGFFCLLVIGHIILLYFYSDAIVYPLPGGTINIGIEGQKPSLNVLNFDTKIENDSHDTVLRFVHRGLIRFSPLEKKIVSDLANCDLKSFPLVSCSLNQNALWNDGSNISKEDVIATYAFFREKALNPTTKGMLSNIEISEKEEMIIFRFKTHDITAIQSLFVPILRKVDLVPTWDGAMSEALSFSGPYILTSREVDKNTILLSRNPYYTHTNRPFFFDQIRFGFGSTINEIYKTISPDIILANEKTTSKNIQWNPYIPSSLYSVFMNTEKLTPPLRKSIFYDILGTIDTLDESILREENIFLSDISNTPRTATESTFFQTVSALGYTYGGTFQAPENTVETPSKQPLSFITKPGNFSPVFIADKTIEIQGKAPPGTTKVIINDYTLRNFSPSKKSFSYTAKKEFSNLAIGQNIYRVSFYNGEKILTEESLTLYHDTEESLTKMRIEWEAKNAPKPAPTVIPNNLDPKKLYNRDGKPLTLTLVVQKDIPYITHIAGEAEKKLTELGVEVTRVDLSSEEIVSQIKKPEFSYELVFSEVNLGLLYYNVGTFLHSDQIAAGNNPARIRDTSLDSLTKKLTERLYYDEPDKLRDIQINIQKIMEREFAVYTLGSPLEYFGTKSSIKGLKVPEFMAGRELLIDNISRGYFKEGYKLSPEPKNILGFFSWLKNELFSST